jgi:hypothetical protein
MIALTKAKMSLIELENSSEFNRKHPLVAATAKGMGLDVDTVFNQAIRFKDVGYDPFAPEPDPEEEI